LNHHTPGLHVVYYYERKTSTWKRMDWIAGKGGMTLMIAHPDYMNYKNGRCGPEQYPADLYKEFLHYVKSKYDGQYWNPLPKEMARFWKENMTAGSGKAIDSLCGRG
jgi:hypothetical protein